MTAKEILMRYQWARREAKDIEVRMAELRLKYACPSAIKYSDMPTAHNANHDLSDYAAKLDKLEQMLINKYSQCMGIEVDIYMRIDKMEKQSERELLRYRYIDNMTWEQIASRMDYDVRHIYRLHGCALQHFPIN